QNTGTILRLSACLGVAVDIVEPCGFVFDDRRLRFSYASSDTLLLGRESAGVPPEVHEAADARLLIPMRSGVRSLNVAVAAAMVLGEALRQTKGFPPQAVDDSAER